MQQAPDRPGLGFVLPGHRSPTTVRQYTEMAGKLLASEQATALIDSHGGKFDRAVRAESHSSVGLAYPWRRADISLNRAVSRD